MEKKFKFINAASRKEFLSLPQVIVSDFGHDLNMIQQNEAPVSEFRSLASIGAGVIELKKNGSPAFRCVYCAKYKDTVYILHSFEKTNNGVDRHAMDVVKQRYKEMLAELKALH